MISSFCRTFIFTTIICKLQVHGTQKCPPAIRNLYGWSCDRHSQCNSDSSTDCRPIRWMATRFWILMGKVYVRFICYITEVQSVRQLSILSRAHNLRQQLYSFVKILYSRKQMSTNTLTAKFGPFRLVQHIVLIVWTDLQTKICSAHPRSVLHVT